MLWGSYTHPQAEAKACADADANADADADADANADALANALAEVSAGVVGKVNNSLWSLFVFKFFFNTSSFSLIHH